MADQFYRIMCAHMHWQIDRHTHILTHTYTHTLKHKCINILKLKPTKPERIHTHRFLNTCYVILCCCFKYSVRGHILVERYCSAKTGSRFGACSYYVKEVTKSGSRRAHSGETFNMIKSTIHAYLCSQCFAFLSI